jgi:dihydrodipicolinate synthase/N-acetylneuraminate lyase
MTIAENRRKFLAGATALAGSFTLCNAVAADARSLRKFANGKPMTGVFAIGWTVCTPDNKLDVASMAAQQKFLNRGKVAGIAWPQGVSHWENITQKEWSDGADALLSVKGKSAVVLGVQTVDFNPARSAEYAKDAQIKGADAVMSQCKPGASQEEIIAYFQVLSKATTLPLMVQTTGKITLDQMVALSEQVPQIVAVKDEAEGDVLARAPELLARTHGKIEDFSGHGGNTMFAEMDLGFTGTCPYVGMADVQQTVFDLYMAGKKREAFSLFGRYLAFNSIPRANDYVLVARGVLPEDSIFRGPAKAGARPAPPPITAAQKAKIRTALDTYLKPYLIG